MLHPTGRFCKKIMVKLNYIGKDKQKALECYLEIVSYRLQWIYGPLPSQG